MRHLVLELRIASLSLLKHTRRTILLASAVMAVTALLVLLDALASGIQRTLIETATTLTSGHLNVGGFFKVTAGRAGPVVTDYSRVLSTVEKELPELDFAVSRGRGWGRIISDGGGIQAEIAGVDIAREHGFRRVIKLVSGRLDELSEQNTILLFESQVRKLDVKVGDAVTITAQTARGVANTVDCRVIGIARDVGLLSRWSSFVSSSTLNRLYQLRPDVTGVLQLHLVSKALDNLPRQAALLRAALERSGYEVMPPDAKPFFMKFQTVTREAWTGQKLDVTTWEDELSYMMWTLKALKGLTFILMTVLLSIVVVGIMNTIWIAIRERTKEIGTLRAIGAQRGSVTRMFLFESVLLGTIGAGSGAVLAVTLCVLLNRAHLQVPLSVQIFLMSDTLHLNVSPLAVLKAAIAIIGITGLASLLPAAKAATLGPVNAMTHLE